MYFQSFLMGFASIFTPAVFIKTIILIALLSKLKLTDQERKRMILMFCSLFIVIYLTIDVFLISMEPYYLNNIQNKESVYLFSGAINIGFGLFLVEFLSRKQAKPLFDHPYKYFLIGVFSIFFTLASFSSTGTIIGVIQLNFLENQSYLLALIPVLILCLGLILPIGFLVYFLDKKITKIKEHKTTRIVQSIIGGAMIVTTIVRLFL